MVHKKQTGQKMLAPMLIVVMCLGFATSASAASSNYSFRMELRVVNGAANGQFHQLGIGNASLSGTQTLTRTPVGVPVPDAIQYELRLRSGNSSTVIGSFNGGNSSGYVSGNLGRTTVASSSYYLIIFRGTNDGWHVTGSGRVSSR